MFRKLALALVAPLLLVTACASEGDQGAIQVQTAVAVAAALRAAPAVVGEERTGAFEMVVSVTGGVEALEVTAAGVFDIAAEQMAMEVDLGAMVAGLPESTGEPMPPGMDEPLRFVVDGTIVYLRIPLLDVLTGSSDWLSATPEELGQGGSLGIGSSGYDPSTLLEVLRGVSDDVEASGQATVRGVLTTRYTATVSLTKALEETPGDQREGLEAQLDQLGFGDADLPMDVWVDADGLPRRMTMRFGGLLAGAGMGDDASVEITMELFDYGEPVEIEVPSPDEVTPFTDVMGGFSDAVGASGS